MNIFRLDDKPHVAAAYHCDKHVVKMILETAQLLATAHGDWGWRNHPCAIWARESSENYYWLYRLGVGLCAHYCFRYDRVHSYQSRFEGVLGIVPAGVPIGPPTPAPQCMPDEYKGPDAVQAYRRYYVGAKLSFARWRFSARPVWIDRYLQEVKDDGSRPVPKNT